MVVNFRFTSNRTKRSRRIKYIMAQQDIEQLWELQTRQSELRRHVVQLSTQLNSGERERAVLDFTLKEMDNIEDDVPVYKPVGKMFVVAPKKKLMEEFKQAKDESSERDENKLKLREQFVEKLKDSEKMSEDVAAKIEAARRKNSK